MQQKRAKAPAPNKRIKGKRGERKCLPAFVTTTSPYIIQSPEAEEALEGHNNSIHNTLLPSEKKAHNTPASLFASYEEGEGSLNNGHNLFAEGEKKKSCLPSPFFSYFFLSCGEPPTGNFGLFAVTAGEEEGEKEKCCNFYPA